MHRRKHTSVAADLGHVGHYNLEIAIRISAAHVHQAFCGQPESASRAQNHDDLAAVVFCRERFSIISASLSVIIPFALPNDVK